MIKAFAQAFSPVTEALQSHDQLAALLGHLGWDLDPAANMATVQGAFSRVTSAITALQKDAAANADAKTLAIDVGLLTSAIVDLGTTTPGGLPPPFNSANFWAAFAVDILEYLIYRYLRDHVAPVFGLLSFVGVLSLVPVAADPAAGRHAFSRMTVDWDELPKAIAKPNELMTTLYAWGSDFKHDLFIEKVVALLMGFGAAATKNKPPDFILDLYYEGDNPSRQSVMQASASPVSIQLGTMFDDPVVKIAVVLLPIPDQGNRKGKPVGLSLFPVITGQAGTSISVTDHVSIAVSASLQAATVRTEIRPSGVNLAIEPVAAALDASIGLTAARSPGWSIVGDPASTHLEVSKGSFALTLELTTGDVAAEIAAGFDSTLVLDFGESDGFLQTVLGKSPQKLPFGPGFSWSNKSGLRFNGQAGLDAAVPVNLSIAGIVKVDTVYVTFKAAADSSDVTLKAAVTGRVAIGPVVASIDKVGLALELKPVAKSDPPGNLGSLDLGFGFKPPDGIGLALSAPGVIGVGFLDIDTEHHQYLGAIAITVGDIDISAVGVLNTKLPEGSGYSLIVVVSASFPPIELGFGFDLTGIGGLVGVNRTVDVPALQALARSGGLDQLMFPEDLIHKAPQVAANLAAIFPSTLQHFLIGPALRIEWGTDGILDAEIGILIELIDAGGGISILRVALLGFFHITLPQAEAPVADITLDVLGLLDIPAKTISIDAGMRDSKVAGFVLTGQAALRAGWGAHASFVLAIGGFNPAFNAPAGFPLLARIALSLGDDNPRLRFASYFALTPNTLQFGAAADLYASEGPVAVTASLSFDVLIQFKPFGLLVDLTISAAILFNNSPLLTMNLALHLSGPDPWHVTGRASITVLFATFSVPINVTIGDAPAPQLPTTVSLDNNLTAALADLHNWQMGPPSGGGGVVVRSFDQANKGVHPMASLTVRQHAVPLHQPIDRYGPDLVTPCSYDITKVQLGSQVVADKNIAPVTDQFAPAQFITLSDADKLSAPSFEPMQAGVTIGAAGLVLPLTGPSTDPRTKVVDAPSTRLYDLLTLDVPDTTPAPPTPPPSPRPGGGGGTRRQLRTPPTTPPARRQVTLPGALLKVQHAGAAAAVNGADGRGAARFRGPVTGFAVVNPTWAILGLNLAPKADGRVLRTDLSSKTAARSWVEREVPAARVQVVYKSELPGALARALPAKRV